MPLRWGPRHSNVFEVDEYIVVDEQEEVAINPFDTFMDNIQDLRYQYRMTDNEWVNIIFEVVSDIEPRSRREHYRAQAILDTLNTYYGIATSVYQDIYNLFEEYFLKELAHTLSYYYPEYDEPDTPSYDRMWNSLNAAVASDCDQRGAYFKPVSYERAHNIKEALQDAFVPPDMLEFCRGAKELAAKCRDVPLAAQVIEEANRILTVQ